MSTAAEHTPGPWSVPHFAEPDANCQCSYVLCDHLMGAIASVYCSGKGDDWQLHGDNPKFAEACANARLIAAAPDMLAALKTCKDQLIKICNERDLMADSDAEAIAVAVAAIVKATVAHPQSEPK